MDVHRLLDVTVVADAGMISAANQRAGLADHLDRFRAAGTPHASRPVP
jgi:hypothetical protein